MNRPRLKPSERRARAESRAILPKDIDWDLKRPCADCPFKRSTSWHQGVAANCVETTEAIFGGRFAHTCHKTDGRSDSDEGKRYTGRIKHCRGALLMLTKTGRGMDLQRPLINAIDRGQLDIEELARAAEHDTECFTVPEFLEFQALGAKRKIERKERRP